MRYFYEMKSIVEMKRFRAAAERYGIPFFTIKHRNAYCGASAGRIPMKNHSGIAVFGLHRVK